jgi:hypothetical protein
MRITQTKTFTPSSFPYDPPPNQHTKQTLYDLKNRHKKVKIYTFQMSSSRNRQNYKNSKNISLHPRSATNASKSEISGLFTFLKQNLYLNLIEKESSISTEENRTMKIACTCQCALGILLCFSTLEKSINQGIVLCKTSKLSVNQHMRNILSQRTILVL